RRGEAGRQRGEREAVLASMLEGVLAVDGEERVIVLNLAAARLLRVEIPRALGRPLGEVARNADLRRFVGGVLAARAAREGEFRLDDPARAGSERIMQAHGTVLRDGAGSGIGALVVLNDVTRLRRLETVRREFVANVSHELKTPITAIKGFVETLLEGEAKDRAETLRFLEVVARQADRLNAIIEDLLTLSRIEQEETGDGIALAATAVCGPLQAALLACEPLAREREIPVTLDCAPDLEARVNAALLEQAVINLVDNALKYSEAGRPVLVAAMRTAAGLEIRVRDGGCGIAREHLPRLFERFYRVDRGRSRRQGGTGLGLAIVKHIVKAHGGTVGVESAPGEGSTFTIVIP
ncbi:MAG: ATP-binding protein, partial [Candidatus Krumholzibacteriia bacterium]